jgi:hypothetical protein
VNKYKKGKKKKEGKKLKGKRVKRVIIITATTRERTL